MYPYLLYQPKIAVVFVNVFAFEVTKVPKFDIFKKTFLEMTELPYVALLYRAYENTVDSAYIQWIAPDFSKKEFQFEF